MYKKVLEKIIEYYNITIFRHERPDGDATFSCLALAQFIKDNFKDKKVKLAGNDTYDVYPINQKVSDNFIKKSLALVCDTSTSNRVDDTRFKDAKFIIKFDHHMFSEEFGNINIVKTEGSACCEILGDMFLSKAFSKYNLSDKTCSFLYSGILTDSQNFTTNNTTVKTLEIASKLANKGNLKVYDLSHKVFDISKETFEAVSKIRNYVVFADKFAYIILKNNDLKKIKILGKDARNHIDELGNINSLNVWAFFTYNEKTKLYDGSLRSVKNYPINEFALRYNGGGHKNASGVNKLSLKRVESLIDELNKYANK